MVISSEPTSTTELSKPSRSVATASEGTSHNSGDTLLPLFRSQGHTEGSGDWSIQSETGQLMLGCNVPAAEPLNFCHAESCLCATKFQVRTAKTWFWPWKAWIRFLWNTALNFHPLKPLGEHVSTTAVRSCGLLKAPTEMWRSELEFSTLLHCSIRDQHHRKWHHRGLSTKHDICPMGPSIDPSPGP